MTTWKREERVIREVTYRVPTGTQGAPWRQVQQALDAAVSEFERARGRRGIAGDTIRVSPGDGEIFIKFRVEVLDKGEAGAD